MKRLTELRKTLNARIRGQSEAIDWILSAALARLPVLIEGPPGVGKTSLARALTESFQEAAHPLFQRIQMTSDLLPAEIVGILRPSGSDYEFREGPLFSHFVLVDELNRAHPKTQAALLEAMAEKQVSVDGRSYPLPNPFFLMATQNPLEDQGVYPLPESQLDRFCLNISMGLPSLETEWHIYSHDSIHGIRNASTHTSERLSIQAMLDWQNQAEKVTIEKSVLEFAHALILKTREDTEIQYGVSIRGGLQFLALARSLALLEGRDYVLPDDLIRLAPSALAHRLKLSESATTHSNSKREKIHAILASTKKPR